MRFFAQHIIFFLILFFAFNIKAYSEDIFSSVKHAEYDCECWALSDNNIIESKEDECTPCCCVIQQNEDSYFSSVTSLPKVNFSGTLIIDRKRNFASSPISSLYDKIIPFHIIKTSFPFLQVILA